MKKKGIFLILILFFSLVFGVYKSGQSQNFYSGINPLSNSLKMRQLYYNKGNLVPNSSFEQAKIFKNDSLILNFKLANWSVIGKNVELTDVTKIDEYNSTDAFQGKHAIKIVRKARSVKEINNESDGILSDYIQVIPGNFDFYFDIRLNKIIPTTYLDRFQSRIGKNIDIHIEFYDKNKRSIDPGIFFEYVDKEIDNSFKGFAFSNYFLIDKFDWARVRGTTWNYPFSEGDLPGNCRYIKIFFGLKCSGTMWIDNVDFRLSRWNFSPLERMDSMFNKKYDLSQLLIPTPQFLSNPQHINVKNKKIEIVYRGMDSPESMSAITLLQKRLIGLHVNYRKIYKSEAEIASFDGTQIILITANP